MGEKTKKVVFHIYSRVLCLHFPEVEKRHCLNLLVVAIIRSPPPTSTPPQSSPIPLGNKCQSILIPTLLHFFSTVPPPPPVSITSATSSTSPSLPLLSPPFWQRRHGARGDVKVETTIWMGNKSEAMAVDVNQIHFFKVMTRDFAHGILSVDFSSSCHLEWLKLVILVSVLRI